MINAKEIHEIRKHIIDGVHGAKKGGVVCDYPDSFTIESEHNGMKVTVEYPIFNTEDSKYDLNND